jgi:hypothetical protein
MDSAQEMEKQDGAADVMEDVGMPSEETGEAQAAPAEQGQGQENANDPLYVQKRLKQQKRAHDREIRELNARIEQLQSSGSSQQSHSDAGDPYESQAQPGSVDEQIHKAVSYALGYKEREERKAKEAEAVAHVQRQYQELNKHLDNVADKYDDFDDVVRGKDTPFTPHMRDAALFLDMDSSNPGNAGEVLYKLAKNPEELSRISKLHPLDQAREMVKLSKALISGGEQKAQQPRPLGQIKNTPVTNSHAVTEKTPIGSLRQRMKSGNWK